MAKKKKTKKNDLELKQDVEFVSGNTQGELSRNTKQMIKKINKKGGRVEKVNQAMPLRATILFTKK